MLDFVMISTSTSKKGKIEVYPKFVIKKSSDLMIRGSDFYAIWVEEKGFWSTDEQDAFRLIDRMVQEKVEELEKVSEGEVYGLYLWDSSSGMVDRWHRYCQKQMRDNFHPLDETLLFSNADPKKEDYATRKLPYPLEKSETPGYESLMSVLYSPKERRKIEWAIGSIVCGESKRIQKFLVLYGSAGTGKSTVLNIIQQLFDGYYSVFDAKALGSSSNSFALEAFKSNPLVAIQHDGDLSRIEDNTRLNSLVSHELMTVNEKFKSTYSARFNAFLFMGTNKPVRITDSKSGIIRRLIDVSPTGDKIPFREYTSAMDRIPFELGGIAQHCLEVYRSDPHRYDAYIPKNMMSASNDFYNFISDSAPVFVREGGVTLKQAWEMYQAFCENTKVPYPYSQRVFKEELKTYFRKFEDRHYLSDGTRVRNWFEGFRKDQIDQSDDDVDDILEGSWIDLNCTESLLDKELREFPAQYANDDGTPKKKWERVTTKLEDLDTSKLHYILVPENHIVIDFDIPGPDGGKNLEANLREASKFPPTYVELSKSGGGVHLHYIWSGDPSELSRIYADHIEVKVFGGKSALRRKVTRCNDIPVAVLSSGLPLKGGGKTVNFEGIKNEKMLRHMIKKNLNKEYHPNTKPSIDFIAKLLDDAYESGIGYDVSDMRSAILGFAMDSTHQADYCVAKVGKMRFSSEDPNDYVEAEDKAMIFYDVEVYPNLFVVCWKRKGKENPVVKLINPAPSDIESLLSYRLIGFNNRKYDNHILYARLMGYDNAQLYKLSKRIIENKGGMFKEAYNLSYTDVYDFAAKKQGLKKWEIELGIHHQEMGIPWDEPVPEDLWDTVTEYCANDVMATEAVFDHLEGDWTARQILAELAEMPVNSTTNQLTAKIIFGNDRHPDLVYTDLATGKASNPMYQRTDIETAFPGYEYILGDDNKMHNMFRGVDLGKGGYVYAEPGMYRNVALLDISSLHPHSLIAMNYFGKYTKRFEEIVEGRVFIKHHEYDKVRHMFDGKIEKYLEHEEVADALAYALKIAINAVYGMTSASFENIFKDPRNVNNIVALRGALFMKTLQDEVAKRGFTVAHIKTDSIKIPDATPEIISFCLDFAKRYGYTFEHEATYDRMCLVNNAVYIAKYSDEDVNGKHANEWTATGTQFQVPYVFKTLFSNEPLVFEDFCETKSVKDGAIYLDMNEGLEQDPQLDKEYAKLVKEIKKEGLTDDREERRKELEDAIAKEHNYIFVGRVGQFTPIQKGHGGGLLTRTLSNGKYSAVTGSTGYRWMESEMVKDLGLESYIDKQYYIDLADTAKDAVAEYGDFETFID